MVIIVFFLSLLTNTECVENLSPKGTVFASSSPNVTLIIDKDNVPGIMENNYSQCAFTKGVNNTYPWWQVDLLQPFFQVGKVVIYTNMTRQADLVVAVNDVKLKEGSILENITNNTSFRSCTNISETKYYLDPERMEIDCHHIFFGGFVTIVSINTESLILCKVEVFGKNSVNIALNKPTSQSSKSGMDSSCLAVDGKIPLNFSSVVSSDGFSQCSFTSDKGNDKYPWWRVDLEKPYIIEKIHIYNVGNIPDAFLHDVEIRVGMIEIDSKSHRKKKFKANPLCNSFIDTYLAEGLIIVECTQPLYGQYVSIQIVKRCEMLYCVNKVNQISNILSLCEVEVFGNSISLNLDKVTLISENKNIYVNLSNVLNIQSDVSVWYTIDLNTTDIVKSVVIYTSDEFIEGFLSEFKIWVGNTPTKLINKTAKFFSSKNILCSESRHIYLSNDPILISCFHPILGRYIMLESIEKCNSVRCIQQVLPSDFINRTIQVLGYHYNSFKPVLNAAFGKPTSQSSTEFKGYSALAADDWLPDMTKSNKCTFSGGNIKPWWIIKLDKIYMIAYILIYFPFNFDFAEDDIKSLEIRVGNEDVTQKGNRLNFNPICVKNYTEKVLECSVYHVGRYVSLQRKNVSKEIKLNNILPLCEVEIYKF